MYKLSLEAKIINLKEFLLLVPFLKSSLVLVQISFSFFIFISPSTSLANDSLWQNVNWKSGQVLGISTRMGFTPVSVHLVSLSKIDHLGLVSVESDGIWIYQFTNRKKVHKVQLSEAWETFRDKNGKVHYVIGEFPSILREDGFQVVKNRFDNWIKNPNTSNPPTSCINAIIESTDGIASLRWNEIEYPQWVYTIFNGAFWEIGNTLIDLPQNPVDISSLFSSNIIADSSIDGGLHWSSQYEMLKEWQNTGDLSKFARFISRARGQPVSRTGANELIPSLVSEILHVTQSNRCSEVLSRSEIIEKK